MLDIFHLNPLQKVLFYSAIISIITQSVCIYIFIDNKQKFNVYKCICYIIFYTIALLFYHKIVSI